MTNRPRDPRKTRAYRAEKAVQVRLEAMGLEVTRTPHNERWDLMANGVKVEVKAASLSADRQRYQANLHGNQADILVIECRDGRRPPVYFIVPFALVAGRTVIKISSRDPLKYNGRLAFGLEAWEQIKGGCNG